MSLYEGIEMSKGNVIKLKVPKELQKGLVWKTLKAQTRARKKKGNA
jgi:hypothetical protein